MSSNGIFIPSLGVAEQTVGRHGTPTYLTCAEGVVSRVRLMIEAFKGAQIYAAIKAAPGRVPLQLVKQGGATGIDAVSPFEVNLALEYFPPEKILYTGVGVGDDEMKWVGEQGVPQNIGSLSELERYGQMFSSTEVSIRLLPGVAAGETEFVQTGGIDSKFGIALDDFGEVRNILARHKLTLVGIHGHIGSGFSQPEPFETAVAKILEVASEFPTVKWIDAGGGYGIRYKLGVKPIDLAAFNVAIQKHVKGFGREIDVRLEPGKFLFGESTALLVRVNTVKQVNGELFALVDTGFNHMLRTAMYQAQHPIVNISNYEGELVEAVIGGNVCEGGDIFGKVEINNPREGDILAILTAGAYGAAMQMAYYNGRPPAASAVVFPGEFIHTIQERPTFHQLTEGFKKVPEVMLKDL